MKERKNLLIFRPTLGAISDYSWERPPDDQKMPEEGFQILLYFALINHQKNSVKHQKDLSLILVFMMKPTVHQY